MDIKEAIKLKKHQMEGCLATDCEACKIDQTLIDYCSEPKQKEPLQPIFETERQAFKKLWHSYHAKHKISYSYDEAEKIFNSIVLIFREEPKLSPDIKGVLEKLYYQGKDGSVLSDEKRIDFAFQEISRLTKASIFSECQKVAKDFQDRINKEYTANTEPTKEVEFNIQSMDARVWAKEFNRILVTKGEQPYDESWLISWFANAIMAGYDEAIRRANQPTKEVSEPKVELDKIEKIIKDYLGKEAKYDDYHLKWDKVDYKTIIKIAQSICSHFKLSVPSELEMHREIARIGLDQDCEETDRIVDAIHSLLLERT